MTTLTGGRPSITDQEALQFHSRGRPGKLEIIPTKPMATQRDLSLAYSPGVAAASRAIAADPAQASELTARGNLVAVITNGTAVTPLSGYTIYYGTTEGALTQSVVVSGASTLTYTISGLTAGTWYFAVAADAADGTQSAMSEIGSKTF